VGYAEENSNNGVLKFYAINNTLINDYSNGTFFDIRSGTTARIVNNIFYGAGTRWSGGTVNRKQQFILIPTWITRQVRESGDLRLPI